MSGCMEEYKIGTRNREKRSKGVKCEINMYVCVNI